MSSKSELNHLEEELRRISQNEEIKRRDCSRLEDDVQHTVDKLNNLRIHISTMKGIIEQVKVEETAHYVKKAMDSDDDEDEHHSGFHALKHIFRLKERHSRKSLLLEEQLGDLKKALQDQMAQLKKLDGSDKDNMRNAIVETSKKIDECESEYLRCINDLRIVEKDIADVINKKPELTEASRSPSARRLSNPEIFVKSPKDFDLNAILSGDIEVKRLKDEEISLYRVRLENRLTYMEEAEDQLVDEVAMKQAALEPLRVLLSEIEKNRLKIELEYSQYQSRLNLLQAAKPKIHEVSNTSSPATASSGNSLKSALFTPQIEEHIEEYLKKGESTLRKESKQAVENIMEKLDSLATDLEGRNDITSAQRDLVNVLHDRQKDLDSLRSAHSDLLKLLNVAPEKSKANVETVSNAEGVQNNNNNVESTDSDREVPKIEKKFLHGIEENKLQQEFEHGTQHCVVRETKKRCSPSRSNMRGPLRQDEYYQSLTERLKHAESKLDSLLSESAKAEEQTPPYLDVKVICGRYLPVTKKLQNGADPYVEIFLVSKGSTAEHSESVFSRQTYASSVQHNTTRPQWGESFRFTDLLAGSSKNDSINDIIAKISNLTVFVLLMDHNKSSTPDVIGECAFPLADYLNQDKHVLWLLVSPPVVGVKSRARIPVDCAIKVEVRLQFNRARMYEDRIIETSAEIKEYLARREREAATTSPSTPRSRTADSDDEFDDLFPTTSTSTPVQTSRNNSPLQILSSGKPVESEEMMRRRIRKSARKLTNILDVKANIPSTVKRTAVTAVKPFKDRILELRQGTDSDDPPVIKSRKIKKETVEPKLPLPRKTVRKSNTPSKAKSAITSNTTIVHSVKASSSTPFYFYRIGGKSTLSIASSATQVVTEKTENPETPVKASSKPFIVINNMVLNKPINTGMKDIGSSVPVGENSPNLGIFKRPNYAKVIL